MPELPEVETIRRDLSRLLTGRTLRTFTVFDRKLLTVQEEELWRKRVVGKSLAAFTRIGKYLFLHFESGDRILVHLRMTGQLIVSSSQNRAKDRPRLFFEFDEDRQLSFVDQRRFGEMRLLDAAGPWRTGAPLGPDALDALDAAGFKQILRRRTTKIHPLLLNQSLIAGVGNIYSQEALFKAAIRPTRAGHRLSADESGRLFDSLRMTLETAILHRGSTSRNYRDAAGETGSAQRLHAVYQRGGKPCIRCQTVLRTIRLGGRGTVYCPQCQK